MRVRTAFCGEVVMRCAVWARSLPHFATAKIKDFSRTNQARLKDPRLRGRQASRGENPALLRAAIERRHRAAIRVVVRYQGECMMGRIIGFLFGILAYTIFL